MQKLQIFAYKSTQGQTTFGVLRNPHHVAVLGLEDGQELAILSPPLPSFHAYRELEIWKRKLRGPAGRLRWLVLGRRQQLPRLQPPTGTAESALEVLARIQEVLAGRLVPERRLVKLLRDEGYWPSQISCALDLGVFRGEIAQLPGFTAGPWGSSTCSRCGSQKARPLPCGNCGDLHCLICLECSSVGEHRACSTLLARRGSSPNWARGTVELSLAYELTPAQQTASAELLDFWGRRQGRALVWAACGAGKTEVAFALIQRALEEGQEVLFAIPRKDIVREIAQRLQASFPGVEVAAHHGGQPWLAPGRLVAATTHQVLHFYQRFGLAILDEVDAFPFQGNEMLRFGLERALAPQGQLVEMTATPSGPRPSRVITIPARHHGFPLPEPEILVDKLPPVGELEAAVLPPAVVDTLAGTDCQWLVFAPTIAACTALHKALVQAVPRDVGLCHSKLESREQMIDAFRSGLVDILVSTSVLERGVNFSGIGVMVRYADHPIFSASALVQMAGRVGRSAEAPTGTVLFAASRRSPAMGEAVALIRELNEEARRRGLLVHETTT